MNDGDVGFEEIHGFRRPGEFTRFQTWVRNAEASGDLSEVPVMEPYSASTLFVEKWYRARDGGLWRLVAPDVPFLGVFERIHPAIGHR